MADLEIVSNELCPYTQRAVIGLIERGMPFKRIYIDLAAKPDWFLAASPLGKVPMLTLLQLSDFACHMSGQYEPQIVPGQSLS
jgi:glutathione S-transferase